MNLSSASPSSTRDESAACVSLGSRAEQAQHHQTPQQQNSSRKRVERDPFSLALDPTSSNSNISSASGSGSAGGGSGSSSNGGGSGLTSNVYRSSRRPSSVFEHVGGVLDRFGRRLYSRSEVRDASTKRPSSSAISLTAVNNAASDSSEAVSLDEELSPGESVASHSFSSHAQQAVPPSAPHFWQRSGSSGSASAEGSGVLGSVRSSFRRGSEQSSSRLSIFVASPPTMHRNHSAGSSSISNHDTNAAHRLSATSNNSANASTLSRRVSVIDRVLIQVTEDNERFSVVDISGLNSADAVKERMLSKLHLFDEEPSSFALSRTEIGAVGSTGPRLDDDELLAMCWQMGDDRGTLKFLLHQIAPPATAGRAMMPPPQQPHFSPRIVMNDLGEGSSTTNTATTPTSNSRQEYSKSASVSSRSSVGEQSHQGDSTTHGASDTDLDNRTPGGWQRTAVNANQRRSLAASTSAFEDAKGETSKPLSAGYDGGESSPIEEINDALDVEHGKSDTTRRQQARTTGMQMRHSIHGQWDSEAGTSSSFSSTRTMTGGIGNSGVESASPTQSSAPSHGSSRPGAHRTSSQPLPLANDATPSQSQMQSHEEVPSPNSATSTLPRSLLAGGGREQRFNAHSHADASRMYTGSTGSDYEYGGSDEGYRRGAKLSGASSIAEVTRSFQEGSLRSHSANPFGPRPSTGDARVEMHPFFGPGHGGKQHTSQAAGPSNNLTSPVSPMSRSFDRERSSSFGAVPPFQGPSSTASMQDLRGHARQMHKPFEPVLRPIVTSQQHPAHMQSPPPPPGYLSSPPMRPVHNTAVFQADRRYMGTSPAPSNPSIGRPPMYEFGARSSQYDPRLAFSAPRPSMSMSDRSRYPPTGPVGPQQFHSNHHQLPHNHAQLMRDDPTYMAMHFPASNSRMVSEFQRNATSSLSSLQPGKTVQETMQQHRSPAQQHRAVGPSQMQFRPAPPNVLQSQQPPQHRIMRTESLTGSAPMMHSTSLSSSSYGRDGRTQQRHYQGQRNDVHPSAPSSGANHLPPSMLYYNNPARPSMTQRSQAQVQIPPHLPSSPRTSSGPATATSSSSSSITSPAHATSAPLKAAERSSGSSFNTTDSSMHVRMASSNDGRKLEGEHSAPTSARSSRTSRSMSPTAEEKPNSELPYTADQRNIITATTSAGDGDLNDEDLRNIRPLPRLPEISTDVHAGDDSTDEDTFRAGQWRQVLERIESGEDGEGTARALPLRNLTSANAKQQHSPNLASSTTSLGTVQQQSSSSLAETDDVDEGEGTFKTFDDEDDEDDDQGGTWAQPLDTATRVTSPEKAVKDTTSDTVQGTQTVAAAAAANEQEESTLMPGGLGPGRAQSPRRPVLTLNIVPTKTASPTLIDDAELVKSSSNLPQHQQPTPSPATSSTIGRRSSFARRERGDWAFRPPPEQLYENLDDFFSKHDLDKPVLGAAAGVTPSSPQANSPRAAVEAAPTSTALAAATSTASPIARASHGPLGMRTKSIRLVAQDRKRLLERTEAADRRKPAAGTPISTDLSRRRSTKLWGGRVIEVTPGSETPGGSSDSPTSTASTEGQPVFKWVKGDLIGKGTYGRVYLALNATTGEMIAVKQVELPTTDSDREDARQKSVVTALKSEIETLKDLDHPNIVSYLGFEETRANLSIFLEYVPGGSVGSCLRKHGKLDEATIKSFLQQILNGLNYLHGRGILHRDLKADNLLVDYDGNVKISDFGTVRKSEDIYGNVASMSMQGSIFWMAPEVVSLSRAGYSAKVDIWSLGCVVLEMFAGRRPWSDEEAVQAMFKIGAERRAPPIPPDVRLSKAAAHFLKTCFAVDPNERPTTSRLLDHVFPHAEPGWAFAMSSLYRQLHR